MYKKVHPNEIDLARWNELDGGADGARDEMTEHLRWCGRCRSVVADHRWLQEKITTMLAVAADAVSVPRPKWWAVQEVLLAKQRRQVAGWRGSAIASVVLSICLMLWTGSKPRASPLYCPVQDSALLGTSTIMALTAQTSFPEALYCPVQDSALVAVVPEVGDRLVSTSAVPATPTPALLREVQEVTPPPTPVLVLPPTPAQPET
ncbi:MAG: hypothetical protein V3S14_11880 [Anaerolineae bacterium]